jgi:hypothetical protein
VEPPNGSKELANFRPILKGSSPAASYTQATLFQLYPRSKAVWEIRSVQDSPSIRVFGLFAEMDVFVATNFALRSELGGWESREWKQARRNATVEWNGLFKPYHPLHGDSVDDVVTGAISGRYFKDNP